MAKIKRSTARIKEGIGSNPTGSTSFLQFPRKGVITGASEPIKVKRPNQYKKRSGTSKK